MPPSHYTRIVLAERPKVNIQPSTFRRESVPYDLIIPEHGGAVIQVDWLSLDPAMRGWLKDTRSYIPPVQIGAVMRSVGLGTVIYAKNSTFSVGDVVYGAFGWTEYAVMKDQDLRKIQVSEHAQSLDFLGPLGMTGLTAYFGLFDIGHIKAGETLVVSGAAGAVGSIACQIGKIKGLKVIAIAGSDEKCAWLQSELGVDKAINYKSSDFHSQFKEHVGFLDVYFDNVGGEMLDFVLTRLKQKARIVLCGAISAYNDVKPSGLSGYLNLISQRAKIEGFVVFDYANQFPPALEEMGTWIAEGKLKRRYHIVEGLEKAPEALPMLFSGGNTGKLVVRVSRTATANL